MLVSRRLVANAILVMSAVVVSTTIFLFLFMSVSVVDIADYTFYATLPTAINLAAAYVLAKGYLAHGQAPILAFGSANLVLGLVGVTDILFTFYESTLGPSLALGSTGGLLFSSLNFCGAFLAVKGRTHSEYPNARSRLTMTYTVATVTVALLGYSAVDVLASAFFAGPSLSITSLKGAFSALTTILLLASSALLFLKGNQDAKSRFLNWYAIGLVSTALLFLLSFLDLSGGNIELDRLQALLDLAGCACFLISAFVYLQENPPIARDSGNGQNRQTNSSHS